MDISKIIQQYALHVLRVAHNANLHLFVQNVDSGTFYELTCRVL